MMLELISSSYFSLPKGNERINQDTCLPPLELSKGYLFAIADGLGGYTGGKEASQKVINHLRENFKAEVSTLFTDLKNDVTSLSASDKSYVNAATTLTFCYVLNSKILVGHIGDCRLYAKKNNKLIQITRDHTQKQELIDQGVFTKKQLENSAVKNILTTAISRTLEMKYETFEISASEIVDLDGNINLFLMSDGAHSFWEKRPRFSENTLLEPSRFSTSIKRRIESGPPIDDYSLIAVKFKFYEDD